MIEETGRPIKPVIIVSGSFRARGTVRVVNEMRAATSIGFAVSAEQAVLVGFRLETAADKDGGPS